jgi:hypothetical protein
MKSIAAKQGLQQINDPEINYHFNYSRFITIANLLLYLIDTICDVFIPHALIIKINVQKLM